MTPKFRANQKVQVKHRRDQIGVITSEPQIIAGEYWYEVFFRADSVLRHPESNLELYTGEFNIESLLMTSSFAVKETMSRIVTSIKLEGQLWNNVYALYSSRTHFLPYQYKPVFKFLDSHKRRLLIADEVGLGKTIEAGLVYLEEKARYSVDRVLVVCPKALWSKWRLEMLNKFGEEFEFLDAKGVNKFLQDAADRGYPQKLKAIVSLQSLRGKELQERWHAAAPPLDLVIVDEAHHMRNSDTLSHRLGRILSETAETMLLLTATPIHLGNMDLFNLLRVLDDAEFDSPDVFFSMLQANEHILSALRKLREKRPPDFAECEKILRKVEHTTESERFTNNPIYKDVLNQLKMRGRADRDFVVDLQRDINSLNVLSHIVTRTRKRDVDTRTIRRARRIPVEDFTKEEYDFYNAVTQYVIAKYREKGLGQFGAFISIMPQRQVASCIPAMRERYLEEHKIPVDEDSDLSEYLDDEIIEAGSIDIGEGEKEALIRLINAAKAVEGVDTKFDKLVEVLQGIEQRDKVMIFSYFKRTLEYLCRRLRQLGYPAQVISGDYPDEDRQEKMRRFREDPKERILLSSEVGSEGLDFEFCHIMINYDLPWNPMKVEQRIGRLDRIGQDSDAITILNLTIPETIEDRILYRLYERIEIFERSIGDLEAILGEEIRKLSIDLMSRRLTAEEQDERIEQTADAICKRRKDWEEMENTSSKFIGHDQFFLDEMARVQENRRYVSAEELITLIKDFLLRNYPKCSLEETEERDIWYLKLNAKLCNYIRERATPDHPHLIDFLSSFYAAGPKGIKVTFDSEKALQQRTLHFINIYHPLVAAIKSHYLENPGELHPVAKVQVQTNAVPEGEYLYMIHLIDIQCARPRNLLEIIFVPCDSGLRQVSSETGELLLSHMVTKGKTYEDFNGYEEDVMMKFIEQGNKILETRITQRKNDAERINEALVVGRLASLDRSFEVKIGKKKELLTRANQKGADPRYIRMLEGGIRNLNTEYERKRGQLEAQRQVSISYKPKAGGILRVVNENN